METFQRDYDKAGADGRTGSRVRPRSGKRGDSGALDHGGAGLPAARGGRRQAAATAAVLAGRRGDAGGSVIDEGEILALNASGNAECSLGNILPRQFWGENAIVGTLAHCDDDRDVLA
jgi:hypothetical protein